MRRYRYQNLRNKSNVPMSVRNYDRHGMENLKIEGAKPLDRVKFPPWALYLMLFSLFAMVTYKSHTNEDLDL